MNKPLFYALLVATSLSIAATAPRSTTKTVPIKRNAPRPAKAQAVAQLKVPAFVPLEPQTWQSGTTKVLEIAHAKKLYLTTPLTSRGKALASIAAPSRYLSLAKSLQEEVRKASGVTLPIIDDTQLASDKGLWNAQGLAHRNASLIILGNLETSRLVPILYAREYTQVDAGFPGANGHVLQTIHDPWGNGNNAVLIGGSDDAGVGAAAGALIAEITKLPHGGDLALPRLMNVRVSQQTLRVLGFPATIPDAKSIARTVQQARAAFAQGQHTGLTKDLVRAATGYARTGADAYAELFKQLARAMIEIYRSKPTTYGGPWGMDADFNSAWLITGWDMVEESPAFTEAERLEITKIIAQYASYVANYGNTRQAMQPGIRHNHNTFPNLGTYFAAEYFGKYYQVAEAEQWLANADACFQAQALSFKSQEDANGYQWLTMQHTFRYALARPDHKVFTNGNARAILNLSIATMDNMGWQSPFGDVGGIRGTQSQIPLMAMGACYFRDPGYRWALEKMMPTLTAAPARVEYAIAKPASAEPSDFNGARTFPISQQFFDYWSAKTPSTGRKKPWIAGPSEAYEKATFRGAFDEGSPYVLLDGIGCGGHRHFDGNAIIRYSDRNRQWFSDGDYIEALPKYHTTVLVYRDGQSEMLPPFCALDAHADLHSAGMLRSTIRDYAGADWARNLIWLKGLGFVCIDSLKATEPGDYSFRAVWHTIGEPTISGSRFTLDQHGERMVLENVDGARLKLENSEALGRNLTSYTNAAPVVRILQQVVSRSMAKDDTYNFLNFFGAYGGSGESPVKVARASESSIRVSKAADSWVVGVTEGRPKIVADGIVTDADIYAASSSKLCLSHVRMLARDGQVLLQSDSPVNVELDWSSGKAFVDSTASANLTLFGEKKLLTPGQHTFALTSATKLSAFTATSASQAAASDAKPVENAPALNQEWTFHGKYSQISAGDMDGDGNSEILLGDGTKRVICVGLDGKQKWEFQTKSPVTSIWAGKAGAAVGCDKGTIHMLDASGKQRWTYTFPYYKRNPFIVTVFGADLDGDGEQEIICGTESWHYYALSAQGKKLWQFECVHDATCGMPVDLDGDGKQDVLAGTRYYSWHGVGSNGKVRWSYRTQTGPHTTCVSAGDLDGNTVPEIVFGGADGNLHVLNSKGAALWLANTGDEVTGVAIAGKQVFATSTSFNVFAFDGKGRKVWRRELADVPRSLAVFGSKTTPQLAVGSEDGAVSVYSCDGILRNRSKLGGPIAKVEVVESSARGQRVLALSSGEGLVALTVPGF